MTKGEQICHAECYCPVNNEPCLPCKIDDAILREKEPLRKKIVEYENGFWAQLAARYSYMVKQLQKKISEYESLRNI